MRRRGATVAFVVASMMMASPAFAQQQGITGALGTGTTGTGPTLGTLGGFRSTTPGGSLTPPTPSTTTAPSLPPSTIGTTNPATGVTGPGR